MLCAVMRVALDQGSANFEPRANKLNDIVRRATFKQEKT